MREHRIIRFGVFQVDLESGELFQSGVKVKLPDQPFQILTMLLEHPGEVVTREQLCERLWSHDTFVDFEHSLNAAVKKLREALGDSADNPRFVETFARRGYRFIAPVQTGDTAAVSLPAWRKPLVWLWAAGLLAILAAAGGLAWLKLREQPVAELKAVPVTSLPGLELHPALSPDARRLAFVWDGPERNNFDVYVKEIGSEEMVRLTKDPAPDYNPAWSPDGQHIAFLRQLGKGASVFVVPAGGGQERKLSEISEVPQWGLEVLWSRYCDWSPDGRFLAVAGRSADRKSWSIDLVSLETGQKRPLTTSGNPGIFEIAPAFSPDGRVLAFLRGDFVPEVALLIQPLSNDGASAGPAKPVAKERQFSSVSWMPGGQELVVSGVEGTRWVSVTGSRSRQLSPSISGLAGAQISLRGTRLVYTDVESRSRFFRISLAASQGNEPAPFLSSTRGESDLAFSPDGQRVSFSSDRSGESRIWVCNTDGSGCYQLPSVPGAIYTGSSSWSPDGRRLAFDAAIGGTWHVYISATEGSSVRRLASGARPRWSRDGQWIYFASTRSGESEIWKARADLADADAKALRITRRGGIEAVESADGRHLYYARRWTSGVWRLPLGGSGDVREEKILDIGGEGLWSLRPDGILVLDAGPGPSPMIRFFEFATGGLSDIVHLPADWVLKPAGGAFVVSPDGKWAIVTQERLVESDIMLVENFR